MKKSTLPDSFKKRKLLFDGKTTPEQLISYGEMYLQEGRYCEASEFFRKASYPEGQERLRAIAQKEGDSFLYEIATKDSEQDKACLQGWEEVGKQAMGLKKFSHAVRAFQKADNPEALKKAEEALKEVLARDQA